LLPVLYEALERAGIAGEVEVVATSCRNRCETGPSMNVYPGPVFYSGVDEQAVEQIVREHFVGGRPVERLRMPEGDTRSIGGRYRR
jgi:(2Fe-2S) ferredoxin